MKSNIKRKYQKPEINKIAIDNGISFVMMSGGSEGNAPKGPFGKIEHIRKDDPFRA